MREAAIHHSRLETQLRRWRDDVLWLYLGDFSRQRGQIVAKFVDRPESEDLRALEKAVGRSFNRVYAILNVFVADDLLDQGYGIQLYGDLARAAADRHSAPIVSAACYGRDVSDEAKGLWRSRRLSASILVRGFSAWGGPASAYEVQE